MTQTTFQEGKNHTYVVPFTVCTSETSFGPIRKETEIPRMPATVPIAVEVVR